MNMYGNLYPTPRSGAGDRGKGAVHEGGLVICRAVSPSPPRSVLSVFLAHPNAPPRQLQPSPHTPAPPPDLVHIPYYPPTWPPNLI